MKSMRTCVAAFMAVAAVVTTAGADDQIKLLTEKQPVRGTVTDMTATEVSFKQGPLDKKFAVNEIESIAYDNEPLHLTSARRSFVAGKCPEALTALSKIESSEVKRPELKQDADFFKAYSTARLALAGSASVSDAGKLLLAFEKAHPRSYHYLRACEVIGDLFTSIGKYDQAATYYGKLAAAPWPDYKMRANVALGRGLLGRKDYNAARDKFDEVLKETATGPEAENQRLSAALGKASALSGQGEHDEAMKLFEATIAKVDAENGELHARAYNAKGEAQLAAGKKQDALMSFLHVDLLFSSYPEQHAEALANLATLWKEVNRNDRATAAAATLKEQYPSSRWLKKQS